MKQSIYIDASHYGTKRPTGVEVYVDSLLPELHAELLALDIKPRYITLEPLEVDDPLSGFEEVLPYSPFWGQLAVRALLKRKKPHLYYTPSGIPPIKTDTPTALTVHDLSFYDFPTAYNVFDHLRLRYFERLAAQAARMTVIPSQYVRTKVAERWGLQSERLVVAPSALPIPRSTESERPKALAKDVRRYFFYMGRVEEKKNLQVVIQAYERYSVAGGTTRLVLAGGPGYGYEKIQAQYLELPIDVRESIHLIGYVSDEERRWLYENAEIVIVPSPYEGFGFPVLEGFAARIPVLTVNDGGAAEVAGNAAYLVAADSVTAFTEALDRLSHEKMLREELVGLGVERLGEYSWTKTARQIAAALVAAIGNSR